LSVRSRSAGSLASVAALSLRCCTVGMPFKAAAIASRR
jgi:hypothetical protein